MKNAWDIRLEQLSVGYGTTSVLQNVSAVLPASRVSVILGGSGCGKSTLLRHILGLLSPQSGKIWLGDIDLFSLNIREFRRVRRNFGVLFQDGALLGALTLAQNVALPLKEHTRLDKKTIHQAALRTLSLVGLEEFAHYYPHQLSGGMRKRAGLARAIITEPTVLLCDEPTSGLDPITAAQMDQLLLEMRQRYPQMSIIVVSHDLASLANIADTVLVLRAGAAVFSGSYAELLATTDPYLQHFLQRKAEQHHGTTYTALSPTVQKALQIWLDS
ncbi:MAG: ATP-binding cassette domain-containing protein [Desulfovibrionaceae bacterium]